MYKTTVKRGQVGPRIDGMTLLSGSVMVTSAKPPSHYSRFGDVVEMSQERQGPSPATPDEQEQRRQLAERYETLTGKKPGGNMKPETMQKAIDEAEASMRDDLAERYETLFEEAPAEDMPLDTLKAEVEKAEQEGGQ